MLGEFVGYVYLIEAVGTGFYKIGHARSVSKRLEELRKKFTPQELRLLHTFACSGWAGNLEYRLHQWFLHKSVHWTEKHLRSEQEWFVLDDEDVQFIKALDASNCRQRTPGVGPISVHAADPFNGKSAAWLTLRHGNGRYDIGPEGAAIIGSEDSWEVE
ncbi:MAG: GIY-YIG nuclease family protein [Acidobacteriota bacterium]|nr:GIY-YIG nuclease family protein [Acidobacteriota bacterium]